MPNLVVSNPVDTFLSSANQVAMLAALANGGVFDFSTFTFELPGSVQFATNTLVVSNSLTLAGVDGSTLNIGAGGALGANAFNSTFIGTIAPAPSNLLAGDGAGNAVDTGISTNVLSGQNIANTFVLLNNAGQLPAVDGSLLTGIVVTGAIARFNFVLADGAGGIIDTGVSFNSNNIANGFVLLDGAGAYPALPGYNITELFLSQILTTSAIVTVPDGTYSVSASLGGSNSYQSGIITANTQAG